MLKNDQVEEVEKRAEVHCRHCGNLTEKQPYISTGDTYCSENCFLKTRVACYQFSTKLLESVLHKIKLFNMKP